MQSSPSPSPKLLKPETTHNHPSAFINSFARPTCVSYAKAVAALVPPPPPLVTSVRTRPENEDAIRNSTKGSGRSVPCEGSPPDGDSTQTNERVFYS